MTELVGPAYAGGVSQPATSGHTRRCATLVAVLVFTTLLGAENGRAFGPMPAFIPAYAAMTAAADAFTAVLLLQLYRIGGAAAQLAAGAAYLVNALLIVPYTLTFPGVIDPRGFIGNEQSAATLWLFWHLTFPLIVAAGTFAAPGPAAPGRRRLLLRCVVAACLAFGAAAAIAVTLGRDHLPILVRQGAFAPLWPAAVAVDGLVTAAAIVLLVRPRRARQLTTLQLWLIVALVAAACDLGLNAIAPVRYSLPWYVGKAEALVSASIVLVALLGEWSGLQDRLVALDGDLTRTRADRRALGEQFARERAIAATLQRALLPSVVPAVAGLVVSTAYRSAESGLEIGGDWYDAFLLADGRLAVTIGDVAGHGLVASIVMGKIRQSLRLAAAMVPHPAAMLAAADGALRAEHPDTIVTSFVGLLDPRSGVLQWASAGHPPAMIRHSNGQIVELAGEAPPLGLYDAGAPSRAVTLEPAAFFVAYTDGLIEYARDVLGGLERVRRALADPALIERPDAAAALFEAVVGEAARDDVAVITISLREYVEAAYSSERVLMST